MPLTPYPSLATMPEVVRNGGTIPPSLLGTVSGTGTPSWISLKYDVGIPDDATITGVGSPSAGDPGYGTQTLTSGPHAGQTVTQAIQATLDRAAAGPLGVLWDVRCAIGTPGVPGFPTVGTAFPTPGDELLSALKLRRPGNLHVAGIPGCGAILRAQCNAAMFANELPTFGTAVANAGTDQQINGISGIAFGNVLFENLYLNANSGTITTITSAPNQPSPTYGVTETLNFFRLFGVQDVTFRGCTFVGHAGFGIHLGNWQRLAWHQGAIQSNGAGGPVGGNDCFHMNGPGRYFLCRGIVAGTEDDHFSINCGDGNNWSGRNHGAGGVGTAPAWGSLLDIDIEDVLSAPTIRGNLFKIGAVGGCLIDRVRIRRVRGQAYQLAYINNSQSDGATPGPIGAVDFSDIDCDFSQGGVCINNFAAASSIRRVALEGVRRSGSHLSLPALQVNAGTVSDAAVSDYYASDDGTSGPGLAAVRVFGGATISRLSASGVGLAGSSAGQVMPLLQVDSGGTVASAIVEGVTGTNIASVILNNGTLTNLGADNIKSDLAMTSGTAPGSTHGSYYGSGGGGSGTVTTASVVAANGFGGTVASPTTTPAITLTTSVTGLLKGNGTGVSAAVAGTDYQAAGSYAPLASPTFTGTPAAPTAAGGTSTTQLATTAFVAASVAGMGSGSVTSVGLSVPSGLSVSGSPVTGSGTLAITTALSGVLKGTGSGLAAAVAGTDYLAPAGSGAALTGITGSQVSGNIAGSAGGLTASIAESQVTGLVSDLGGKAMALARTAVKTAAYTAVAGDLVPVDTTSGAVTITLASAPADKSRVAIKHVVQGGTNAVTVACGGTDVFNRAGGATSTTLSLLAQGLTLEYNAAGGIWTVVSDDLPLSQLDLRYSPLAGSTSIVTLGTVASGVWQGTPIAVGKGGTGLTTVASGKLLYASALDTLAPLTLGTGLSITTGTLNAAGGVAVGGAITSGTNGRVLYQDASGNLAESANLQFSGTSLTLGGPVKFSLGPTITGTATSQVNVDCPGQATGLYVLQTNGNVAGSVAIQANNGNGGGLVGLSSGGQYTWSPSNTYTALGDTGLARAAAGVVQLTNAATGAGGLSSVGNTPTTLAANANNYSPGVGIWQRWSASTPINVTGMVAGQSGEIRYVANAGSSAITLTNQDASSTAANRWLTTTGSGLVLGANQMALAIYDATTAAWRASLLP